METLHLLKEEINKTMESEHDFAKWKLIVTAALGGAALGSGKDNPPHYWLLLFIPFVCAYIDLHLYQYQHRIMVLAQFIRQYRPAGARHEDFTTLQAYEDSVDKLRGQHVFDLGQYANLAASIILSLVAPGLAVASSFSEKPEVNIYLAGAVWGLGFVLILSLWFYHKHRLKIFSAQTTSKAQAAGA